VQARASSCRKSSRLSAALAALSRKRRTRHFYSRVNLGGRFMELVGRFLRVADARARARVCTRFLPIDETRGKSAFERKDSRRSRARKRVSCYETRNVPLIKSHD